MKIIQICTALAIAASVSSAQAGVVSGTNIIDASGNDIVITDNTGAAISVGSGFISLGYFTIDDSAVVMGSTAGAFLSTIGNFQSITMGGFGDEGLYVVTEDYGKGALDAQSGRTLYTLIGNGSNSGNSDQFVLYQHDDKIDADGASPGTDDNQLNPNDGSLLFGTVGGPKTVDATNFLSDDNYMVNSSFAMTVVPEPSSTALLGLGGLALIIRRRR